VAPTSLAQHFGLRCRYCELKISIAAKLGELIRFRLESGGCGLGGLGGRWKREANCRDSNCFLQVAHYNGSADFKQQPTFAYETYKSSKDDINERFANLIPRDKPVRRDFFTSVKAE